MEEEWNGRFRWKDWKEKRDRKMLQNVGILTKTKQSARKNDFTFMTGPMQIIKHLGVSNLISCLFILHCFSLSDMRRYWNSYQESEPESQQSK